MVLGVAGDALCSENIDHHGIVAATFIKLKYSVPLY
jgi:hypothetical protein